MTGRPIEFAENEAFQVTLSSQPLRDAFGPRRFRIKKARDARDEDFSGADLDAIRWLREKRGVYEDGAPYSIQRIGPLGNPYREEVPVAHVTVEVPVFYPGTSSTIAGRGRTLGGAVEAAKTTLMTLGDSVRTYPEFNAGLDRVLLKVGEAELRVADLCALIRDYYDDDHSTGGALHCVLDDGNMGDGHIRSDDPDDKAAVLIAELLKLMTTDERQKLYERGYGR